MTARRTVGRSTGALAALTLVTVMVAACGGSTGSHGSGAEPTGAALTAAAKKEGSLTWYTSYRGPETVALAKAFNKKYPGIKVNTLHGTADKLSTRLTIEQRGGTYKADLFQGDAAYGVQLVRAGALQPYSPPHAQKPPSDLDLPDGYQNVDAVLTTAIAYNPTALKRRGLSPPTSLADFTRPEWKGRFSVDPEAVNWYESLISSMGHDKAHRLLTALGDNSPVLTESHTLALTQVRSGEPMATVTAYGYLVANYAKQTPDSVAIRNTDPLPASPDLIELVKKAPHPSAAKLFMDWLLSPDGQRAIGTVSNRISLRTDVKVDATAWNPAKWKPAWSQPSLPTDRFNSYSSELRTALKAK